MLHLLTTLHVAVLSAVATTGAAVRRRTANDGGQATAEYALVLLGAATIALLLVAWAAKSGKIADLLDAVIDKVLAQV